MNNYGFGDIKVTIYIMDPCLSLDQIIRLHQHFIDIFKLISSNILYKILKNPILNRFRGSFHIYPSNF